MAKRLVFLACTGLGRINRGYETWANGCFLTLRDEPSLDMYLYKGGGPAGRKEITVLNLPRSTSLAELLANVFKKDGYFIEQSTFFVCFLPHLFTRRPDVIFFSDFFLGTFLWNFREKIGKKLGLKYKLVFCNGAPNGPPFTRMDLVQQLLPCFLELALDSGEPPEKHFLLPLGLEIKEDVTYSDDEKRALRQKLGIPLDKKIIISVGAIQASHKRMDYLIREVSALANNEEYFLVMLGQFGPETKQVQDLAQSLLPGRHIITSVHFDQVKDYYATADLFVLCSLKEGFGLVYIEALRAGLPVLAHDFPVAREVLQSQGYFADFSKPGELTKLIESVGKDQAAFSPEAAQRRRDFVRQTYSWEVLKPKYVQMLTGPIP
jgi:1,2-diacylglycerol 3-alpha-glucosyltransferase